MPRAERVLNRVAPGVVRIIGGRWRGSKLPVADAAGLRPTADRVRETLFNWLQPMLAGANVLDLFAGTGALGFEAASRGAAKAVLIERDPNLAASLRAAATRLHAGDEVEVANDDALHWLARVPDRKFDLIFLDPPFAAALWQPALAALAPWLADGAWLYLESPREAAVAMDGWVPHREGHTRDVRYALYRRGAATLVTIPPRRIPPAHDHGQ